MAKHDAVVELSETQAEQEQRLAGVISELLDDPKRRQELGDNLHKLAHQGSAKELAQLLITSAKAEL
jgi:UDP-N-acetylglucosamine:LPS N-acetylglucosamine transferase